MYRETNCIVTKAYWFTPTLHLWYFLHATCTKTQILWKFICPQLMSQFSVWHLFFSPLDIRAAYCYKIRTRYRYYLIPIQGIEMTHSKRYSKSILTSGIWEKSNNIIIKYRPTNHKVLLYSNKIRNLLCEHCPGKFCGSCHCTLSLPRQLQ